LKSIRQFSSSLVACPTMERSRLLNQCDYVLFDKISGA